MPTKPVHTLNARDHIMLEFIEQEFALSPRQMLREIQCIRDAVDDALCLKGIEYDSLKGALVPDRQRHEIALVFDITDIEEAWYGYEIFEHIIPLFSRESCHSVLVGDYLDRPEFGDLVFDAFQHSVALRRSVHFYHPTQFFIVYINNLTDKMVQDFVMGLSSYHHYVGMADMTYRSAFKLLLSTMLSNAFIKFKSIILQGHEADRSNEEDENVLGYNFEDNGYKCKSITDDLMGVMLSYKIERPILSGFEADTRLSINSVNPMALVLDDFSIQVEEAKIGYLKRQKAGSLDRAGLTEIDSETLAALIREKIDESYIYSMSHSSEHNVTKFNVIIEVGGSCETKPTRLLAALEYKPESKILRLITLF